MFHKLWLHTMRGYKLRLAKALYALVAWATFRKAYCLRRQQFAVRFGPRWRAPDRRWDPRCRVDQVVSVVWEGSAVAACIDTPPDLKVTRHTFVGDKGHYDEINDGVPQSNGFW